MENLTEAQKAFIKDLTGIRDILKIQQRSIRREIKKLDERINEVKNGKRQRTDSYKI